MTKQIYRNLFNGHSYAYVPRGDASEVVTMTYEEVVGYYNKHYHPSNGQAFCYGQQNYIDACLDALEPVLKEYTKNDDYRRQTSIKWQDMTVLDNEQKLIAYPSNQEVVDYRCVIAWVLNDMHMDVRTEVAWHLIHELLVGSPTAAISRIIFDLKLGDDVIGYFSNQLQQWVLALGVTGVTSKEQVEVARNAIMSKLSEIVNNKKFEKEAMNAALNKMEFQVSNKTSTFLDGRDSLLGRVNAAFTQGTVLTTVERLHTIFNFHSKYSSVNRLPQICLEVQRYSKTFLDTGTMIVTRSSLCCTQKPSRN